MTNLMIDQYVYWEKKEHFLLDKDSDSQWIVYIIEDGSCEFFIEEHSGIARKGDVLICPPYQMFHREIRERLTFHFFRFSFAEDDAAFAAKLSYPVDIKNKKRVLSTAVLLKEMAYDTTDFCDEYRNLLLKDILMLGTFEKYSASINQLGIDYKDPVIRQTILYLSEFGHEEFSISEIAGKLCINPSYLSRKFKKVTNYSPVEYRNRLRIRRAQKLLIETDNTLDQIAEQCGLSNGFYLSRVFSKHLKVCPNQYRASHKI